MKKMLRGVGWVVYWAACGVAGFGIGWGAAGWLS
jgi:hypothetical protein